MRKDEQSYVFSDDEIESIKEMREGYEELSEREKFIVREAFKVYISKNYI
jgi:predicted DNA binding protein